MSHSKKINRLRFIQTAIKSRTGIGKPIVIHFYAPAPTMEKGEMYKTVKYNFRECGEDIKLIMSGDDTRFCLKQCFKMCYYVQKMHKVEILKMRCEFAKDDNGSIWFLYANQIYRRDVPGLQK